MLFLLEQFHTHISLACFLGMVFFGWDLMLFEPSWVYVVPVKCLWDDRKPSLVEFRGKVFLFIFSFLFSLHIGMGVLLLGILLELSIFYMQ
jgi:hypothetical protein